MPGYHEPAQMDMMMSPCSDDAGRPEHIDGAARQVGPLLHGTAYAPGNAQPREYIAM